MILALTAIILLALAAALIVREIHQLLYVREVRHLPMISELQARNNAKPLTHAVLHRYPGDIE